MDRPTALPPHVLAPVPSPNSLQLLGRKSPEASDSSAAPPRPLVPGCSGDVESLGGKENQYSVTLDNRNIADELSTPNQPAGPKMFDLDSYLGGDIDLDDLLDTVR